MRFALIFLMSLAATSALVHLSADAAPGETAGLDYSLVEGEELILILVASSTCAASNDPRLPDAWGVLRGSAGRLADDRLARLSIVGIAVDSRPEDGISFLQRFGAFHEISSGRSWQNSAALKVLFGQLAGPGSVPQVILVSRRIGMRASGRPFVEDELVVWRRTGLDQILRAAGQEGGNWGES